MALPRGSLAITSVLVGALFWGLLWWPLKALDVMGASNRQHRSSYSYGLAALLLLPFALRSFKQWRDQACWRSSR